MDILFLSVSIGGGHLKAAENIKECLRKRYPGSRALVIDTLKYINPLIDKVIIGSYLSTIKNTPRIYGKLYKLSESKDNIYDFSRSVNKILSPKITNLIKDFRPSAIVCTHPFPLQMVCCLKENNKLDIPVIAILTDFVAHSFWIYNKVDAYIVAHEGMKSDMVNRGVAGSIIYPYGLPISRDFLKKKNKHDLLERLGLEDRLTTLIMGGSLGFGEIRKTFLALLKCKRDMQVIVITGKNEKLKKQLDEYVQPNDKRIKILGYTERVFDYMDISDFIITKPGGMTIAESLVKNLPIFIMSPIPGQEEGNARFLMNNGASVHISEYDNLDNILCQTIDNPLRLKHMKEMAKHLSKPNSCEDIVNLLDNIVNKIKLAVGSI